MLKSIKKRLFDTTLVTWTQLPDVTIFNWQLNFVVIVSIEKDASMLYFLHTNY